MLEKFLLAFIPVFVAIDPIGLVALFMGLGTSASHEHRRQQAFLGLLTGLLVAVGFIFLGKGIFAAPRRFPAWIRFGGPGPSSPPDVADAGILSIGMKLTGVEGPKLLEPAA